MRLRENRSVAIHLTRMTANNTMPSTRTVAQWTMGRQEPTKPCNTAACLTEQTERSYCNTSSLCMTDSDSPSNVHIRYLCFLCFAVEQVLFASELHAQHSVETSRVMLMWWESQHVCYRHWLHCGFGYRPLYWHYVKPSHLNLALQCVSVWSAGLWHTAVRLRRGETHTTHRAFSSPSYSSAGRRTAPAASCYVQDLCFCLWSRFAAAVFFPTAHTLSSGWERSVLECSWSVGTNHTLIAHTS